MNPLPALVVGLTATFLAVQDLKGEKKEPEEKEPEEKAVETPVEPEEEVKEPTMDEYEEIVNDEYLDITMEDDLSEIMGEDDEEVAEGETIRAISEWEYDEGAFGFERVNLMYFVVDEVLCDTDMITIDNRDEWLGDVELILGPDEITVMWIRNFNLSYDIRLEVVEDSYSGSR
ncbi:hypothetical protein [Actinomyces oris]|uniref:hypothetical protein n=1 Tax=Actinomyces oris TaxID=544580 RepID=UPI0028D06E7C|nr:hypothetical protein [Actinomyces oris]